MLNLKNTLDGYLKTVEVIGNTVQDTNNLADIRSVGDKVEGQELYKIDVVSCGKNLFDKDSKLKFGYYYNSNGDIEGNGVFNDANRNFISEKFYEINSNTITWSSGDSTNVKHPLGLVFYTKDKNFISWHEGTNIINYKVPDNAKYFRIKGDYNRVDKLQLEEGTQATPYEPYKENKLEILSPVQLEKVGDVVDKIICKDGVWGVDKKVDAEVKNNVLVNTRTKSEFMPLPHDQQVKLRTFAGQTNIAFLTEIPGQIKAQVPKSLGATVNTHTEQIADLHNSLDRVKKLEETTVSTIETESSFTTVDATNNGYFEDIKLEGKTLVNLLKVKNDWICSSATSSMCYGKYNVIKQLEPGKTYTYCYFNLPSKITQAYLGNSTTSIEMVSWTTINSIHTFVCSDDVATLTEVVPHFKTNNNETLTDSEIKNIKIMLLEGNLTNNSLEFFEGLMSVGQGVEEVSVKSVNENLFDGKFTDGINTYGTLDIDRRVWFVLNSSVGDFSFKANAICSGTSYSKLELYASNSPNATSINDMRVVGVFSITNGVIEFTQNKISEKYIYICVPGTTSNVFTLNNIVISKGTTPKPYTPHQSNKKPLLYYNSTTETWEKPILREWDTIEKHSDGKYYYHKRSGEVVLNGSEGWVLDKSFDNTCGFYLQNFGITTNYVICKDFKYGTQSDFGSKDEECVSCNNNAIKLRVLSSKLPAQDVEGFKAWLKDNPTTVVYQLAQEEVYECTNIDLMTYSGETNYIINSGAISPKSLLKVHNNISNVVKILQEKVSLLENTFIAGLKSVLSGDMYSLATILYPEDFEQNDNTEQDIMVIPE